MDYSNLSQDELIQLCKDKNLDYKTKTGKVKAIKTLLSLLKTSNDDYKDNFNSLEKLIDMAHNRLYTRGITGSKAQNDIMKFLTIRIINKLYNDNNTYIHGLIDNYRKTNDYLIDFNDTYNNNLDNINDPKVKEYIQIYLNYIEYLKDINLIITHKHKSRDLKGEWKDFITDCVSCIFPSIYGKDDYILNCKDEHIIQDLLTIISKFDMNQIFINEVQSFNGDIHEKFLKYEGNKNSKQLGQFFTPRPIIKALLNDCGLKSLINDIPELSIYDPCMGTGGLLCYSYDECKPNISPDDIYGCEIESDTIRLGLVSLMISTNGTNNNFHRCNSLVENPYLFQNKKFKVIFTNPPFGTKNKYKELEILFNEFKNKNYPNTEIKFQDVYKLKSNTGINLFIQLIIYQLEENGIACIILPDGEVMTGKSSIDIRKFILDNCKILKIITIEGGSFINTGIQTKALIMQKGNYDNYNQEVEFIELNKEVKVLGIRKLNEKLQFNFEDIKEEIINYNPDIEIKTLGEVCEFQVGSQLDKKDIINGDIPIFGGGFKIVGYHNNYNRNGNETIICGTGAYSGYVNHNYGKPFWASQCFTMKSKNNNIIIDKYLYYYSKIILEKEFMSNQKGTAIPYIRFTQIIDLKIPIPSIEVQNKIVEYFDMIYEKVIKTNNEKIEDIKKLNKNYIELNLQFNKDIEIKTLSDVCDITYGTRIVKDKINSGLYDVYGGGDITFTIDKYNREGFNIIISRFAMSKTCVRLLDKKLFLNDSGLSIKSKYEYLIDKYLGYYLFNNQNYIYNLSRGAAQKNLDIEKFNLMKIPIPSIEKQKEIIEYLDFNDNLIKTLEKENEINKNNAELLMKQILYK